VPRPSIHRLLPPLGTSRLQVRLADLFLLCGGAGFRREAGGAARRDGEPHDLALHHPRQARGKQSHLPVDTDTYTSEPEFPSI
jgi:hypothetical protein